MIADQKQTERLIQAVQALEKRFERAEKNSAIGHIAGSLGGMAKQKLSETFSTENLLSKIGLGRGTLIGSYISLKKQQKEEEANRQKEEASKAHSFAQDFSSLTDRGRQLASKDPKKAIEEGVKLYLKHTQITQRIEAIKKKQDRARGLGSGADISKEEKEELVQLEKDKEAIFKDPTLTPQMKSIKRNLIKGGVVGKAVREFEVQNGEKMSTGALAEFTSAVKKGIDEELLMLSEKQLDALERLVAQSEKTEEDRLESNIKNPVTVIKKKEEEKEKKDTSLLETLFNLTGLVKNLSPMLSTMAATIAPVLSRLAAFALPGAALAGAGTAGYLLGDKVVNPLLDGASRTITGDKTDTFGTALYKANDALKGIHGGKTDEQKMKERETKDRISLGLDKISKGESISASMKTFLDNSVQQMSEDQKNIYYNNIRNAQVVGQVSKPSLTSREIQSNALDAAQEASEKNKEIAEAPSSGSAIVQSNTVNNLTKVTKISAPVRNFDTSYNDRLRATFA